MRILMLGGTGAMGLSLVELYAGTNDEVWVTSRSSHCAMAENIHYIQGNAQELPFLRDILRTRYDAIIDFMSYSTEQFMQRRDILLEAAGQYIFLSSSRVYADSAVPITERSPRLLDATDDKEFLQTDEYALAKARQEDLLGASGMKNWTIVRPYITYNTERLQLGVFEKEVWLYRALHGQPILFPKDMGECATTLTYGMDVARGIKALVGNNMALGNAVHITTEESIRWIEVLEIYRRVFKRETGSPMDIRLIDSSEEMSKAIGKVYQTKYDRLFNRTFDNTLIGTLFGENIHYRSTEEGLTKCLTDFLKSPSFRAIPIRTIAWMDKELHMKTPWTLLSGRRSQIKYWVYRYAPKPVLTSILK